MSAADAKSSVLMLAEWAQPESAEQLQSTQSKTGTRQRDAPG